MTDRTGMGSCGNLGSVHEPSHGAISEQPSCSDFSEEPISGKGFCFGGGGNLMDLEESSTIDPDGCSCDSRDKNASFLGLNCDTETVGIDKVGEMQGDSVCRVGFGMRNSEEKESRVNSNGYCSALDVCEVEAGRVCSEKVGSAGQDSSFSPSQTPQVVSVAKTMMEAHGKCFKEIEQMQVENPLISSTERHIEGSDEGFAVLSNDNYNQEQGLVSEELEPTHRLIPDANLPINCKKQEEGKDSQDVNVSLVPVGSECMREKGDLLTKADEGSDGLILPLGGGETDTKLTSITDSPRNYLKRCESLEGTKDRNNVEIGGDGISCTNEILTHQDAASSDCTSGIQSCQLLSESVLETGGLSDIAADKELKTSSKMRGDIHILVSPSLSMPQLLSSHTKEDDEKDDKSVDDLRADDLKDIADTKTINPYLELPNEADLHSDISEKNEEMLENNICGPSSGSAPAASKENSDMAADITAEKSSQVSHIEENTCSSEAGSRVARSSLRLDFPCISEQGAIDIRSSNDTVDLFRPTDDDGRIGSEVACASGTHFAETILSYSRRRGRDGKQSKKAQTKRIASRSRKSSRMKQSQINFESIFKCSKQKRSCFSKPARSSEWGLPSNTTQIFLQSNNLASDRPPNQGSQNSQSNLGNRERAKNCSTGCPEGSNRKTQTSGGGCLRLKVKFGKFGSLNPLNVTVTEVIDKSLPANCYGTAGAGLEIPRSVNSVKDKLRIGETAEQLEASNNPVKHISDKEPDDSLMGTKLEKKDLEAGELCGNPVGDAADDDLKPSSGVVVEECGRATENRYTDAETSPDSEVINSVPDTLVSAEHQGDLHPTVLSSSEAFAAPVDTIKKKKDKKKGLKKNNSLHASRSLLEDGAALIGFPHKSKHPKSQRMRKKRESSSLSGNILSSPICEKSSAHTYCTEDLPSEQHSLLTDNELGVMEENLELESCKYAQLHPRVDSQLAESCSPKKVLASAKSKGPGIPKSSKCNGTKKGKSKFSDSAKSKRRNAPGQEEDQQKPIDKSMENNDAGDHDAGRVEFFEATGCHIDGDTLKTSAISGVISPDVTDGETVLGSTIEERASADSAWVRCDDCFKWRRIPASLVESIDENCRWICLNNLDKDFAHCTIPQEMSNEEINAELGITQDEADAYDGDVNNKERDKGREYKRLPVNQKACFKAIKINQFLHRNRKAQTIDEIMVCHCKPTLDGQSGCGDECLNRMLNIECVQGTCPCGDLCSNQQFQKRKYVRFERFQSGKKGYGLRLLEDVRKGQFLIEYVGEVLDMQAYEARQKEYAAKGQKHFYFMTLNGNEVVDAGVKGNLGRFINHSCEPNCRTEKWMVNGEICVGIFSLRDIKKGEEVTFDYNYVRVFGAAAKKCYCGSPHCRGYIGGDPLNGDVIVQSDSDDEYPEPVMLEDDEGGDAVLDATSRICSDDAEIQMPQNRERINDSKDHAPAVSLSQSSVSTELSEREFLPPLQPTEVSKEHTTGMMSVATFQPEVPIQGESANTNSPSAVFSRLPTHSTDDDKKTKHGSGEDKKTLPRSRPLMKTSRSSGSGKRDKGSNHLGVKKAQVVVVNKLQQQPIKSKGSTEVSPSGRIETFEGKLNELLDAEGGISKRKDSTKGYLKLLLLTAASRGNANNEGIQSNRDLSMILDALLKTKSRAVLVDVINKNGLQMLHNIMKQYRRDFKKTPILRKLLKVLEYMAAREILTLEHIIRRPPCLGMESFKDSILTLTEHDDKQVHQIARNFRDRWIPKPFRKPRYMDRDERLESTREPINSGFLAPQTLQHDNQYIRPAEPMASVLASRAATSETASGSEGCSEPNAGVSETNGTKTRKRKSRWDQPAMKKEQRTDSTHPQQKDEMNGNQNIQDDLPPGFSSPLKRPCNIAADIVLAQPQGKFLSRLPVSYGIPLTLVHEFGSPDKDASDSWLVAPGVPFHPFPPLPQVSRESYFAKSNGSVSSSSLGSSTANEHSNPSCPGASTPTTAVSNQGRWNIPSAETNSAHNRKRGYSCDIGRRYFRQQKWNVPPWIRNGWQNAGNNFRGGRSVEPGSVATYEKFSSSNCSQGTGFGGGVEQSEYNSSQQH